jgi:hydroxypyruvate isomerase
MCIETLADVPTPAERVALCASYGIDAVEIWGWRDKNIEALSAALETSGVSMVNMSAHRRGSPIAAEELDTFLGEVADTVPIAKALGCPTMMVLSNELGEGGRVVHAYRDVAAAEKRAHFVSALRAAMPLLPATMRLVLEPLNTVVDHVGNYLSSLDAAREIIEDVGDERLGILADLYHLGVMGVDLPTAVREYAPWISHVHLATLPNRAEPGAPGADETDWAAVLEALAAAGYDGAVGFELFPSETSRTALERIGAFWAAGRFTTPGGRRARGSETDGRW